MIIAHGAVGVCDGAHSGFVMKKDRRVGLRACGCPRHPLIAKNAMSGAPGQFKVIPKAGHYAPWEQPEAVGTVLRQFLDAAALK
jgi:pimeloyl-ACP methyl ester carboxylesterase